MDINILPGPDPGHPYYYHVLLPKTNAEEFIEMDNWLWDNIGDEAYEYGSGWSDDDYIYFYSEEDRVKFILKWC